MLFLTDLRSYFPNKVTRQAKSSRLSDLRIFVHTCAPSIIDAPKCLKTLSNLAELDQRRSLRSSNATTMLLLSSTYEMTMWAASTRNYIRNSPTRCIFACKYLSVFVGPGKKEGSLPSTITFTIEGEKREYYSVYNYFADTMKI